MRILSSNECELVSGGAPTPSEAEDFLKESTGKPHECKYVKDHNGEDILSCKEAPTRPSQQVFFG